jgi:hypothetical protein
MLLRRDYVWPSMRTNCKKFVPQCVQCARNKLSRHRPHCLLQLLPAPKRPLHSISMDFIEQLAPSNGFTAILVVWTAFLRNFYSNRRYRYCFRRCKCLRHPRPSTARNPSPRSLRSFTSHFFRSLGSLLHVRLHFTSGHYPSANGQVERINGALEHHLRIYCNHEQDNWSKLLPSAEFAYSNAPHASMGVSPFIATRGYDCRLPRRQSDGFTRHALRYQFRRSPHVFARPHEGYSIFQGSVFQPKPPGSSTVPPRRPRPCTH